MLWTQRRRKAQAWKECGSSLRADGQKEPQRRQPRDTWRSGARGPGHVSNHGQENGCFHPWNRDHFGKLIWKPVRGKFQAD